MSEGKRNTYKEEITMTNNYFEQDYSREQEIEMAFDKAEAANDEQRMEMARNDYETFKIQQQNRGQAYLKVYELYKSMKERGNDCIDFDSRYSIRTEQIPALLETLKAFRIARFTYSDNVTDAIDKALQLQKLGCRMEGLTEINSCYKNTFTRKYEKKGAIVFSL